MSEERQKLRTNPRVIDEYLTQAWANPSYTCRCIEWMPTNGTASPSARRPPWTTSRLSPEKSRGEGGAGRVGRRHCILLAPGTFSTQSDDIPPEREQRKSERCERRRDVRERVVYPSDGRGSLFQMFLQNRGSWVGCLRSPSDESNYPAHGNDFFVYISQ